MQKMQERFSVTLRAMSQFFNWLGGLSGNREPTVEKRGLAIFVPDFR